MVDILLFHKGVGVALVKGGLSYPTLNYMSSKKKIISLPVKMVFATFLDGHCRALLVASESPVLTSSVIYTYNNLEKLKKVNSCKSIGRVIQELERTERKMEIKKTHEVNNSSIAT